MESGIHGCGIRNPQTWNPESTAWNPESKTLLDYLTWGKLSASSHVQIQDGDDIIYCCDNVKIVLALL